MDGEGEARQRGLGRMEGGDGGEEVVLRDVVEKLHRKEAGVAYVPESGVALGFG